MTVAEVFRTAYKKACYLPWYSHFSLFALCNYPTCLLKICDTSFGYAPQGSSGMSYCNQTPFPPREGLGLGTRLGCQSAMVWTGWDNSCPGCMDRLRKRYSHLVGGSFLAGKVAWTLSGCMTTKSAKYCMLVNEWAWSRSRV